MAAAPPWDDLFGVPPDVVPAGAGRPVNAAGVPGFLKTVPGPGTGRFLACELLIAPGRLVRARRHADVGQVFTVTGGSVVFQVGAARYTAGPGATAAAAAGTAHAVWNPWKDPARVVEVSTPGHAMLAFYEKYGFYEDYAAAEQAPLPLRVLTELAESYGTFYLHDVTASIEAACGVTAGGGTGAPPPGSAG